MGPQSFMDRQRAFELAWSDFIEMLAICSPDAIGIEWARAALIDVCNEHGIEPPAIVAEQM